MAANTGTALVTDALEEIGALAAGDVIPAGDGAKGLLALNRMIDSQGIDRAMIYTSRIDLLSLTGGKQKYTIGIDPSGGSSADFNITRPVRIDRANLLLTTGGSVVRRPLNLLSDGQWAAKTFQAVSGPSADVYNDGSYPLSTLYFYPIPDQAYGYEQYSWQQFGQLVALTDNILIPPGYYEYWVYGLAMRLAAAFGRQVPATTAQFFSESRAMIRRTNSKAPHIYSEGESGTGLYNWRSGLEDA